MAKYSYAVIRRAIACKIRECEKSSKKWEFVDDVSDWAIYKTQNVYHLIKFTSKTNDGYKFPFDESKIVEHYDDNITNIFKSLHFNNSGNEQEKCETVEDIVDFNFYLVLNDNENVTEFPDEYLHDEKYFKYFALNKKLFTSCENTEIKISKISKCFNSLSNTGFKVKKNPQNSIEYQINLYSYPCKYEFYTIENNKKIKIVSSDCYNIQNDKKEENLPNIDYNRILERSFIYQIEYGTEKELTEILKFCCDENNNKCIFDKLKEFIKSNQQKLKDKDLITKFNKLSETEKKELKLYDFKNIFKCLFLDQIPIEEFKNKFFPENNERKCKYCGVPENKLGLLNTVRSGRGNRLEYDRIISRDDNENKIAYSLDNIVLACYWCNNAKTDTFSPKDFKPIARGINQVWNEKLKQTSPNKTIYFEENSDIWNHEEINNEDKEN